MGTVWDKIVLDTKWKRDGSTILLFHGDDLEAFFNRAKTWLHTGVDEHDYLMRFITNEAAESLMKKATGREQSLGPVRQNLFINFRNDADATLFKIAVN